MAITVNQSQTIHSQHKQKFLRVTTGYTTIDSYQQGSLSIRKCTDVFYCCYSREKESRRIQLLVKTGSRMDPNG